MADEGKTASGLRDLELLIVGNTNHS
jgi:hypothetical protein